jgi:hypothetical protein
MSNETLQSILGSKTVSFYAIFAKALGSVQSAVMLSQAFFWQEKARFKSECIEIKGKMFFKKTAEEWYEETGLTQEQQSTARAKLSKCGVMLSELAGLPASLHYWVDMEAVVKMVEQYLKENKKAFADKRTEKRDKKRRENGKFEKTSNGKEPEHSFGTLPKQESGIIPEQVDHILPQQETVKNGNIYNIESLESKKESKKESAPQAAFITTHTPTKVENIEVVIVEGQTFDLEEKTNLEPITPAAGKKPRAPKTAGNSTAAVCAEIKTPEVLDFFHSIHAAWAEWIDYKRRERKGTYKSAKSEAATITELANEVNCDPEAARAAIQRSIAKTYTGICPDKNWKSSTPPPRYSLEDRPQAHTPEQMKEELSRFYNANSALLSEAQKTAETNYTGDRLRSIVIDFCSNQVARRREGETFGQHHAALGLWLKRQKEFDTAKNPATTQHTAGPQPQAPLRSAAPVNYSQQGPQLRSEQKAE